MFTIKSPKYGPVGIPSQNVWLTREQLDTIEEEYSVHATYDDGKEEKRGIWEGQRAPDNACMLRP